jgi:hypothetical protein
LAASDPVLTGQGNLVDGFVIRQRISRRRIDESRCGDLYTLDEGDALAELVMSLGRDGAASRNTETVVTEVVPSEYILVSARGDGKSPVRLSRRFSILKVREAHESELEAPISSPC